MVKKSWDLLLTDTKIIVPPCSLYWIVDCIRKKKPKMITYTDHPDIVYIKIVLILLHVVKIQLCSCQSPYASIEKCLHPIESMI